MESPENFGLGFEEAEKLILSWGSTASSSDERKGLMIFNADHRREEADLYLTAVDEIQQSMESLLIETETDHHNKVRSTIQIAMARLEVEFHDLLTTHTNSSETDYWHIGQSSLTNHSSEFIEDEEENPNFGNENGEEEEEEQPPPQQQQGEGEDNDDDDEDGSRCSSSRSRSTNYRPTNSIREVDLIPEEVINDLHSIAERMIAAGYLRECLQIYGSVRKPALESSFHQLGIERLSIGDIQRLNWDALEVKIRRWIRAAKVCIRVMFSSEKRLCEKIFEGLGQAHDADETCFMEIVKGPATQLFNFADAVSISNRSPEKLFKILDLHDALVDLQPDVDYVFESNLFESIRAQASEIHLRLAEAARGIISEFEKMVQTEPSQVAIPGGTVHPLTRYVMNYISLISDYRQTLIELIDSKPLTGSRYSSDAAISPEMEFIDAESRSPLALHLIWIIVVLQFNLEGKSRSYRDPSLPHLFLMNNVHYILQKIKGSQELREMIGDDYLKKLSGKVRQAATSYQRSTWMRILYCLRDEGLHVSGSFSSGVSRSVLRERFKAFNSIFEEVHKAQVTWVIPDIQLREELRISISEKLLPAYRSFLGRFRGHIESGKHPEMYIKYSVDDIENAVLDFFEGQTVSLLTRRRTH